LVLFTRILISDAKYLAMVKKSGEDKPLRKCYEWQVGKLKVEIWVGRLQKTKHKLD
jgi:hypothetical protein